MPLDKLTYSIAREDRAFDLQYHGLAELLERFNKVMEAIKPVIKSLNSNPDFDKLENFATTVWRSAAKELEFSNTIVFRHHVEGGVDEEKIALYGVKIELDKDLNVAIKPSWTVDKNTFITHLSNWSFIGRFAKGSCDTYVSQENQHVFVMLITSINDKKETSLISIPEIAVTEESVDRGTFAQFEYYPIGSRDAFSRTLRRALAMGLIKPT